MSSRASNTRAAWRPGTMLQLRTNPTWRFLVLCKSDDRWVVIGNWGDEQGWRWNDLRRFPEGAMEDSLEEVNE